MGPCGFARPENKLEFGKRLIGTPTYLHLRQGDAVGLEVPTSKSGMPLPARRNPFSQLQAVLEILEKRKPRERIHLPQNCTTWPKGPDAGIGSFGLRLPGRTQ